MTETSPPYYYPPVPPPPSRHQRWPLVVGIAVVVVCSLFALAVAGGVVTHRRQRVARAARIARSRDVVAERLRKPPDTATLPHAADGSVRYVSNPAEPDQHTWHATVPEAWSAFHVGARTSDTVVIDTVLRRSTADGHVAVVLVERAKPTTNDVVASEEFQTYLRAVCRGFGLRITSPYTPADVGDDDGRYFDGTATDDDGTPLRSRVVAVQHGGETFLLFFRASERGWPTVAPEFMRVLRSWGYGA